MSRQIQAKFVLNRSIPGGSLNDSCQPREVRGSDQNFYCQCTSTVKGQISRLQHPFHMMDGTFFEVSHVNEFPTSPTPTLHYPPNILPYMGHPSERKGLHPSVDFIAQVSRYTDWWSTRIWLIKIKMLVRWPDRLVQHKHT